MWPERTGHPCFFNLKHFTNSRGTIPIISLKGLWRWVDWAFVVPVVRMMLINCVVCFCTALNDGIDAEWATVVKITSYVLTSYWQSMYWSINCRSVQLSWIRHSQSRAVVCQAGLLPQRLLRLCHLISPHRLFLLTVSKVSWAAFDLKASFPPPPVMLI